MNSTKWITNHEVIAKKLYELSESDTFAYMIEKSYGKSVKYASVHRGPFDDTMNYYNTGFAEKYDVILRAESSKSPSDGAKTKISFSHKPGDESREDAVFLKRNVGQFNRLDAICMDPLNVDYESDSQIAVECECGQVTKVEMEENSASQLGKSMKKNENGELVTPCCFSDEWTTILKKE